MISTPLPLHRFALGTVQFGMAYGIANAAGQPSRAQSRSIVEEARKLGVGLLDTAVAYGDSESCLGELDTRDLQVVTKLPSLPDSVDSIDRWVTDQIQGSLSRLRRKSLYGLLLHRPEDVLGARGTELKRALLQPLNEGVVRKLGVSIYDPEQLEALIAAMPVALVQAPFNILDRRLSTSGWLGRLRDNGIEVHTRSMLLQGLLAMEASALDGRFAPWIDLLRSWRDWLRANSLQASEACVRFVMNEQRINRFVVGCDNVSQLQEIAFFAKQSPISVPANISSNDVNLLNPARWPKA